MNTRTPATHAAITRILADRGLIDPNDPDLPATCRRITDLVAGGAEAEALAAHLDDVERLVAGRDPWVVRVAQDVIDAVRNVRAREGAEETS